MIEQVISRKNMHYAYKQVMRNKGSAGVDGMQIKELGGYIKTNMVSIATSMLKGSYQSQPILGVDAYHAYVWSRSRKGGWSIAQSPILTTTITLERLQQRGYESMLGY
ncbi:MAG: hypothetical protein QM763_06515 [Agriterribacter sp.]